MLVVMQMNALKAVLMVNLPVMMAVAYPDHGNVM